MVKSLQDEFHIDIISSDSDIDNSRLETIIPNKKVHLSQHSSALYLNRKNIIPNLFSFFRTNEHDVLFVNGIYSFHFTLLPILFFRGNRIILSARGMLHPPALRQKRIKKSIYLFFLKPILKFKKIEYHATDKTEAGHIRKVIGQNSKVWIAPNIPRFLGRYKLEKKIGELNLITVALISPMKNHLKIIESLKGISEKVNYDIIGPVFDEKYWDECKKCISELPSNIKVTYHGPISPLELGQFYASAHIFICPSQSENFGHAFFEAFSAGKPIITSYETPWNDLEKAEIGLNINPNTDEILGSILHFLKMNDENYQIWSDNASKFASNNEGFNNAKIKYLNMFHECA